VFRGWLLPLVALASFHADLRAAPEETTSRPIRGITLSTHWSGADWAHDTIEPTLDRIASTGANWVTIHPYATIDADGTVVFRPIDPDNPPEHVVRPIREAHARGLKIMIKPHLAYWGSPFAWRGEIQFGDDEPSWQRFFASYQRWIVTLAIVSHDADGFAVGTELGGTLDHEAQWRSIIEAVRDASATPLTYAANWDSYRKVRFWDALDVIGIQGYFPLDDPERRTYDPVSGDPIDRILDEAEIRRGWGRLRAELREYSVELNRPVVFTELGYSRAFSTALRPWESRVDGEEARSMQRLCMRVALETIEAEPTLIGVFLWKWFSEPRALGRDFQLAHPKMIRLLRQVWGESSSSMSRSATGG